MDGPVPRSFSSPSATGLVQVHSPAPPATATAPHHGHSHRPSFQWPSTEQRQGLAALSTLNDFDIFSLIASLRLLPPILTDQQLQALVCLRSAPDDSIKEWLDWERRCSGNIPSERSSFVSNLSDSRFSTASSSTNSTSLSRLSSNSQHTTGVESLGLSRIAQRPPTKQKGRAAVDLNKSHPPLPHGFSDSAVATPSSNSRSSTHGPRHERWCTTREHKTVFTTYRGFAKHENEHESYYVFLPEGPIETRWDQCALCEEIHPDKAHLQHHDILKYHGRLGKPDTRSRRANFEDLLKRHKTSSEKIKELLVKWRKVPAKKAYSCGFCITTFRTLSDRTSHIDREHYAKGKNMNDWNDTFVIKGLLLQQEVKDWCLKFFEVDPTVVESSVSWPPAAIEDLQLLLELREETPKALAVEAFRQASSRGAFPPRRTAMPGLRSPLDMMGGIQMSPSAQVPTNLGKLTATEPFQSPNQEKDPSERPEIQHQAYSNDQNNMESSLVSASSPSSNPQLMRGSSGFPDWVNYLAADTTSNAGFIYTTTDNANESVPISPTSRMAPNNPLFHQSDHVGVNELNGLENLYLKWSTPGFGVIQPPSFSVSASEAASSSVAQVGLYHDNVSHLSLEPSTIVQLPKRKLSDKSAQEANSKAPTQAPVSKHSQQYSIHRSGPDYMMHEPC